MYENIMANKWLDPLPLTTTKSMTARREMRAADFIVEMGDDLPSVSAVVSVWGCEAVKQWQTCLYLFCQIWGFP